MDLFTYLMAKKGKKSTSHKSDLFAYLLATHRIPSKEATGTNIEINAKSTKLIELTASKLSTQYTTTGKNLYNANDTTYYSNCTYVSGANTNQYKVKATGTDMIINSQISSGTSYSSNVGTLIPCRYGETIYYDIGNSNFGKNIITQYNSNKVSLGFSALNTGSSSGSYTPTNSNCEYISIRIGNGNATSGTEYTLAPIVSKLSDLTYEPYTNGASPNPDYPEPINVVDSLSISITDGTNTKTIPIDLDNNVLAGIGDYKDILTIDKEGNVTLTKKIGKVVLDGSDTGIQTISSYSQVSAYTSGNSYQATFSQLLTKQSTTEQVVWSNYFEKAVLDDRNTKTNIIYSYSDGQVRISNNIATTKEDFKTWLSTHNTEVYYVLAEPETIDLGTVDISLYKGTNTITNSANADMTIKYY